MKVILTSILTQSFSLSTATSYENSGHYEYVVTVPSYSTVKVTAPMTNVEIVVPFTATV